MKTADPELMRAINRFHVMDVIRTRGPISRTEISAWTELSAATVSAITAALLDDELIAIRHVPGNGDAGRGRPRVMLELNPLAAYVVGVKLAPSAISVAVTDFAANPLATLTMPVRSARQPLHVIADIVEDGVRHSVKDAGLELGDIGGVCVGLPGVVDTERGLTWRSPIFGPAATAVGAALAERLDLDVRVESDVNLATLAEHWFGRGRAADDFLLVAVEETASLGFMHKGELYHGGAGVSADLGWYTLEGGTAAAPRHLEDGLDPGCLGRAVANVASLLAPPLVVLAGAVVRARPGFARELTTSIEAGLSPALAGRVEIAVADWQDDVWARGAASHVLKRLYGAPWSTTGPRLKQPNGVAA
jgi:predicted NBD/HSP70 family sugar kinase